MKIIADENIPFIKEAFGQIAGLTVLPGREIKPETVRNASVLLVRSVTRVDEKLLKHSSVDFVASATIGTDHIDMKYLESRGIGFASAGGSNANSVAEYVIAGLLLLNSRKKIALDRMTLGIVGAGNIGNNVVIKARSLGINVLVNDPPLERKGAIGFVSFDEILKSDLISIHIPLSYDSPDKTFQLFDEKTISGMKSGSILINTSRGKVVSGIALKKALIEKHLSGAVLDVWENEPDIDISLLELLDIGTPHIAGYSFEGKLNGTRMIYEAFCNHFKIKKDWDHSTILKYGKPKIRLLHSGNVIETVTNTVKELYDIEKDDRKFRKILHLPENRRSEFFDEFRKNYPVRHEFFNQKVTADDNALKNKLAGLGFLIDDL